MVFLIQRCQNKDSMAIHLKLNELVAAVNGASNRLIEVESLSEEELHVLGRHYHKLVSMAKRDATLTESHSVEEAEMRHKRKVGAEGLTHTAARKSLDAFGHGPAPFMAAVVYRARGPVPAASGPQVRSGRL